MKFDKHIPPKSANRFLNWFLRDDLAEEVQGDLEEQFLVNLENKSLFNAKINYWYQVFNYLRPFAITKSSTQIIYYPMFRNYFKTSFRSAVKHKTHSLINIFGLSIGIGRLPRHHALYSE